MRTPIEIAEELIPESMDMSSDEKRLCHLQQNAVVLGVSADRAKIAIELRQVWAWLYGSDLRDDLLEKFEKVIKELEGERT